MSIPAASRFLPRLMWADALVCGAAGALQLVAGRPLALLTGLPGPLLLGSGCFLLAWACVAGAIARRRPLPTGWVAVAVLGNFAWAAACLALLLACGLPLTAWGQAWVLLQVAVGMVLGELQWLGLRRARTAGPMARPAMR